MAREDIASLEDEIKRLNEEKKEQKTSTFIQSIPQGKRNLFVIGTGATIVLGYTQEWEPKLIGLIIAGLFFAIYFTSVKEHEVRKRVLTREECRVKLMEYIQREKIRPIGNIPMIKPNSQIKMGWAGQLQYRDDRPFCRVCSLEVFDPDTHLPAVYQINMEPYEGEIIGIVIRPEGLVGDEIKDKEVLLDPELKEKLRWRKIEKQYGL